MATIYLDLDIGTASFKASGFPQPKTIQGTNYPVEVLAYDATTREEAAFRFKARQFGAGNTSLAVDLEWFSDAATTGNVVWAAKLAAITPGDAQNVTTKAFAAEVTVTTACSGTTRGLVRSTLTITGLDSLAADDEVELLISRDAANGADTMTGDACLMAIGPSYSDT